MTGGDRGLIRGRRSRARAAALLTAAALLLAAPAAAQTTSEDLEGDVSLRVQQLTGTLTPGGELVLDARVVSESPRDLRGLRLVGTLHGAVPSRFAFQRAVDDGQLGAVIDGFSDEIDRLPAGGGERVQLERSAAQLGFRRPDQFGVYPLRLQLLHDGQALDEIRTALVFSPEDVEEPVRAAFVLPVSAPPLLSAEGGYERMQLLEQLGRAGQAQALVGSLAARPGFPATMAPDGLLLDEATDLAGGFTLTSSPRNGDEPVETTVAPEDFLATQAARLLERIAEVAGRRNVDLLPMTYGRADLVALIRGDMVSEAVRHVQEGRGAVERATGSSPLESVLWPADGLDAPTLDAVLDAGVDTVVLSEDYLVRPDGRALTPSPVRELRRTREPRPGVLVPDPWLEEALGRESTPHGRPVAVQRVVAETAAVYFERPFAADVRGLLLAPPQRWEPERGLAGALMDGIDEAPWLQPVTVSKLVDSVEPETAPVHLTYPQAARTRELSADYVGQLRSARRALGSLASMLATGDDTPSRFDRMLRTAASVDFRTAPEAADGRALIATVRRTVEDLYSAVELVDGPQVWMDAEGPIPVTVANHADVPLRLRVRPVSLRFEFDDPEGQTVTLDANQTRILTFDARATTAGGRVPVSIVVEDADGVVILAQGTVVVRSTAVSVAALVVTAGAGLFLAGWALRQFARRRRSTGVPEADRQPRPTVQAGDPGYR